MKRFLQAVILQERAAAPNRSRKRRRQPPTRVPQPAGAAAAAAATAAAAEGALAGAAEAPLAAVGPAAGIVGKGDEEEQGSLPPTRPVSPAAEAEEEAPAAEKQEQLAQQGAEADGAAAAVTMQVQAQPAPAAARRQASSREVQHSMVAHGDQGKERQQQALAVALRPQPVLHMLPGGTDVAEAALPKHIATATSPATPAAQSAPPVPQPSPASAALIEARAAEAAQRKMEQAAGAFTAADRDTSASMLRPLQHLLRALDEQAGEALQVGRMGEGAAVAWVACGFKPWRSSRSRHSSRQSRQSSHRHRLSSSSCSPPPLPAHRCHSPVQSLLR